MRRNCSQRLFQSVRDLVIVIGQAQARLVIEVHAAGARITGRHEGIVSLTADPDHLVKAPAESHADFAQERDIRDQGRAHALVPEQVGQDRLVGA